jgi:transcriptional regulator with XRE-family HTH domain
MSAQRSDTAWRLKVLRESAGLSLEQMARELDMPKSTYQHWEDRFKGAYLPFDKAERIAAVLEKRGVLREQIMALTGADAYRFGEGEAQIFQAKRRSPSAPPPSPPLTTLPMGEIAVELRTGPDGKHVEIDKDSLAKLKRLREQIDLAEKMLKD